ncbi:hypothetical protein [Burkholderia pseudomallei]|uniref:hypothetical protein n=1 Tax=Burkholderia pseudomallei TaxID=28450 RepID=UPI00117837A4|nr:hypothetical protein [Burkholderia pseudomallei]
MQTSLTRTQLLVQAQRRIRDQRYEDASKALDGRLAERHRMARNDLFVAALLVVALVPIAAVLF